MSWDNVWPLPRSSYSLEEIDAAVNKALAEFGAKSIPREEWEEEDEEEPAGRTVWVSLPVALLEEHDDEPDEDEDHEAVFSITDDGERWEISVNSNEGQNREAALTISAIAGRVSALLGGSEEPEPL